MDLRVRNVDAAVMKVIDERARKNNVTRSEFVRIQLDRLATLYEVEEEKNKYDVSLQTVTIALEKVIDKMNSLEQKVDEVMYLIVTDDYEEEILEWRK